VLQFEVTDNSKYLKLTHYDSHRELNELKIYFKLRNSKYYFDRQFKLGKWDGFDYFYHSGYISIGLWYEILNFMNDTGIKCKVSGLNELFNNKVTYSAIQKYCNKLFEEDIEVRHYQIEAVKNALKYKFNSQECSTGSGKTLITYLIFKILFETKKINSDNKLLIVVPRIGLVNQTADKFLEYNKKQYKEYVRKLNIKRIGGKHKFKESEWNAAHIIITTNQSLKNISAEYLHNVNCLIIDEAHTALAHTTYKNIQKCINAEYKIGLSGTLDINYDDGFGNRYSDLFLIEERIGPLIFKYKTVEQIEQGYAPDVVVNRVILQYPNNTEFIRNYNYIRKNGKTLYPNRDQLGQKLFKLEKEFIYSSNERSKAVADIINAFKNNTLVLFQDIKNGFGEKLYTNICNRTHFNVYYIDGEVSNEDRTQIINKVENDPKACLVATYGTFSTGIDVSRIFNIVLAESYKSQVLIKQTVGRGIRAYANQQSIHLWDILDEFGKYSIKHGDQRVKIYEDEYYTIKEPKYFDISAYFENSHTNT
jgi:superfamily II DNA or RNA helicase